MKCICCDNIIKYLGDDLIEEDAIYKEIKKNDHYTQKAENRMWEDGVVGNISAGYGSIHDGNMYVIGICDDCVSLKLDEGKLSLTGNYMVASSQDCHVNGVDSFESQEVEKYKKIWRRNNNLDKL